MEKLTDIKHPWKHQQMGQRPPRESIFKRFIKWCWSIITAPFRLIWSLIRALWNLITRLLSGIVTAISALFSKSKSGGSAIGRAVKNFVAFLWPRSQAGWIILLLTLVFLWQVLTSLEFPLIDSNKWQAITLSNNQVYFGRLQEVSNEYATLKDVYYLQAPSGSQTTTNLVKLSEKIYGPENQIYIPKEQIVFWENLGENSQVIKAIEQIRN
ncbi:MAG: hypothetical protein Q8P76_01645 [bacterium]|nr:hypothetical protein [bacterium]